MKRSIGLFLSLLWLTAVAAQTKDKNIPVKVRTNFEEEYPNVKDAKWNKKGDSYEAVFTDKGTRTAVFMNDKGDFVAKEYFITLSDLPQTAQDYLKNNYPGMDCTGATQIMSKDGKMRYEVRSNYKEINFDEKGNFVRVENYTHD